MELKIDGIFNSWVLRYELVNNLLLQLAILYRKNQLLFVAIEIFVHLMTMYRKILVKRIYIHYKESD